MENCKLIATLLPLKAKFSRDNNESLNTEEKVSYKLLVGILIYLIVCCRPDLIYTMLVLSKYLDKLTREYLRAAKYVLRYLNGTTDYGLVYKRRNTGLISYTD